MNIWLKLVFLAIFHFSKGEISVNEEQQQNILSKFIPFDTFHFSKGEISFIEEQPLNTPIKLVHSSIFKYFNSCIFDNVLQSLNISSKFFNLFLMINFILLFSSSKSY